MSADLVKADPGARFITVADTDVTVYAREEFLDEVWEYEGGQHTTIIGPTGTGKTFLGFQLLERTARPELPAVVLVMKPRDATVDQWAKGHGYRTVNNWPPQTLDALRKKPDGWILKPDHAFDPDIDTPRHRQIFRRAVLGSYKKGNRIIFADELYSLCEELDLDDELISVWTKGRSMEAGVWGATQRASHVPLWAYSQATHLFLAFDPDKKAQLRFSEISGMDPDLVKAVVFQLKRHQWLYINQEERTMCVIDA